MGDGVDPNEPGWVKLRSVTAERPLDEFLSTAELASTDFTTERTQNIRIIQAGGTPNAPPTPGAPSNSGSTLPYSKFSAHNPYLLSLDERRALDKIHSQNKSRLTVPRRPVWDSSMTAHELDRAEKEAFLEWRRGLAVLQDNDDLLLTPFERNIEVWRQLWRVVERSDLVVQIVDARNPLFFRSIDLENYVKELDGGRKKNLLLINKADLLTFEQRKSWAEYFNEKGIRYAFFSAFTALTLQEAEKENSEEAEDSDSDSEEENSEDESEDEEEQKEEPKEESKEEKPAHEPMTAERLAANPFHILTVEELEELFLSEAPAKLQGPNQTQNKYSNALQIGLVGYPNVGKSSTINALIGAKKVSVSSTPGKTKHFQTIMLSPTVVLCDCPGLVFPNFATTDADLVCNGVLPIDQLREYTAPTALVTQRIPKYFLEAIYGISIFTRPIADGGSGIPTAEEFLNAYARARGFMRSGQGNPDESRAARYILKDYVNAKLLFVHPPPTYTPADANITDPDAVANAFNSQLYNLASIPEQRRAQILLAIAHSRFGENATASQVDVATVDLAAELESLKFSRHDPRLAATGLSALPTASTAAVYSAGASLDRDFFAVAGAREHQALPFHKQQLQKGNNNKKHNKMNKKKKGKLLAGGEHSYSSTYSDFY
ncbi:hypothetical protein DV451_004548 [Geotrichum candidum]|uniref:CP-type G domain-containing protein n=2 Tax=Geotrichum candidum TaxID=1173061 RepID=A0A9P5KS85_GEOCN|nr:hypothetical protein DV451_004548 [Geotrichum candidum]KAI9212407.1 hypothetical protein DS838_002684 [Geotrichum bryndzae]KAF5105420.1 hypothetical protein DV453_004842 [Geotrichum candidum]KAF5112602.1 hypothetical protein DV452_003975 [Geotrichum candidum]KAF5122991.1 hypothetical protein DV495_004106 [Geotrichum candidum]